MGEKRQQPRRVCRGGRIPSREISISGPAAIAARRPGVRRRETRRKNTCNRTPVFLFREWEPPPPPSRPPPPPSLSAPQLCPGGDRPIHRLAPPFIHEYEIIGNQRYIGHSWRHNEPRPFVNECALVYARAITRCLRREGGGEIVVAGGGDKGARGKRGARKGPGYKLCPLSVKSRLIVVRLIFMSVYRGNRCLNERRCP